MARFKIGDTVVFKGDKAHKCYITGVDLNGELYNGFNEKGDRFRSCLLIDYEKISVPSIKLSQIPSSQLLYIEKDKYSDPEIMKKTDFINSDYFLNKETVEVNVFIAVPEVTRFTLYDWIEWLGEENYEDWTITVYDEIMKNPIANEFLLLVNRVFENHPTYYPGKLVEIDIPSPKCGYGSKSVNELCNKCRHNNVFWENSGCNLRNGMEPYNFEPKEK